MEHKYHKFLLHSVSHTWLVIDISTLGLPDQIYPEEGTEHMFSSRRFQNWKHVEKYLLAHGADPEEIEAVSAALKRVSVAILSIRPRDDGR